MRERERERERGYPLHLALIYYLKWYSADQSHNQGTLITHLASLFSKATLTA